MGNVSDGGVIMNIKGAPVFVGFARIKTPDESQSACDLKWSGVTPSYSGRGCTGTPYIPYALGPLRPAVIERKGAKAVLRVAKDEPSQSISVGSRDYSGDCGDFVSGVTEVEWLIGESLDLTDAYPEPLHIGHSESLGGNR
ncbi:hypothetical protein [Caballeronia telluris]|nr:hypothetical protein [Caballeronia telluris]